MKVKICGITNLEDAIHASECGADALGFVFYRPSPRYIDPKDAKKIIKKLPPFVERVGLFVDVGAEYINKVCKDNDISLAQIHFDADEKFLDNLDTPFLQVKRAKSIKEIRQLDSGYQLVDAYVKSYGGEGRRLSLEWFKDVDCSKIILAGGLNPENIKELSSFGFYGVDVSSGVESTKGKKDPVKVEQFISNAKSL